MSITKCAPCGCIAGTTQNETFKQNVQLILCEILTAVGGGGTGPAFAHTEGSVAVGGDEGVPTLAQVTTSGTFPRAGLGKYDWLVLDNTTGSLLTRLVNSGFGNDPVKQGITGTAYASGDALMLEGGVINEAAASVTTTAQAFVPFAVNRFGAQYISVDSTLQVSAAKGLLKLQGGTVTAADAGVAVDAQATTSSILAGPGNGKYGPLTIDNATGSLLSRLVNSGFANDPIKTGTTGSYSSGDAVFGAAGQVNEAASSISSTAAHYVPFAVNRFGVQYASIDSGLQVSAATGLLKLASSTSWVSADAGVGALFYAEATPSATGGGADGKYAVAKVNASGVQYAEPANQVLTRAGAKVSGVSGGIPTTGATILTNTAKIKILVFLNTTDQILLISLDGGSNYDYPIAATNGTLSLDLAENGRWTASTIKAKADASNTTSGALYLGVVI